MQTFNDHLLRILDSGYNGNLARQACERLLQTGFITKDMDLIFALVGQND